MRKYTASLSLVYPVYKIISCNESGFVMSFELAIGATGDQLELLDVNSKIFTNFKVTLYVDGVLIVPVCVSTKGQSLVVIVHPFLTAHKLTVVFVIKNANLIELIPHCQCRSYQLPSHYSRFCSCITDLSVLAVNIASYSGTWLVAL